MSDFDTGEFILKPVKPKPLQTVKHITIGEHNVPFTIERNDAGTITHYTGVLRMTFPFTTSPVVDRGSTKLGSLTCMRNE